MQTLQVNQIRPAKVVISLTARMFAADRHSTQHDHRKSNCDVNVCCLCFFGLLVCCCFFGGTECACLYCCCFGLKHQRSVTSLQGTQSWFILTVRSLLYSTVLFVTDQHTSSVDDRLHCGYSDSRRYTLKSQGIIMQFARTWSHCGQ